MIRILCHYPNELDTTSWYRGLGVMENLYRQDPHIQTTMANTIHWALFKAHDILFLQRPFTKKHVDSIEIAKDCNTPVWVDYDDLVSAAPESNVFFSRMKSSLNMTKTDIVKNIETIIQEADVVTVSTDFIKEKLKHLNDNIVVINNYHDDCFFPLTEKHTEAPKKVIFWRGSESHKCDLIYFEKEICSLIEKHKDHVFVFTGYHNKVFTKKYPNTKFIPPVQNPMEYFKLGKLLKPKILIVPLENNDFNRAKSNIASLEAVYFGAVCVAPDMPEWHNLSAIYNDNESFMESVADLISDDDERIKLKNSSREHLIDNYLLSKNNQSRINIARLLVQNKGLTCRKC